MNLERGVRRVIIGDDLGCEQYAYLGTRLDFLNVPYLQDIHGKFYTQAELIYYPSSADSTKSKDLVSNLRGSLGFGISWQINDMINFALYYNAVNFSSNLGDIERSDLINFTFNFF